ncbi:MAG: hypothetical protein HFG05_07455 [Oscillibacter sp.]|nr:hypothetical protein [Oscillibacter sp.]
MERRDEIILKKVLSEIQVAREFISGCSLDEFCANELLKRAVCMTVINIGELIKNLSASKASWLDALWFLIQSSRNPPKLSLH